MGRIVGSLLLAGMLGLVGCGGGGEDLQEESAGGSGGGAAGAGEGGSGGAETGGGGSGGEDGAGGSGVDRTALCTSLCEMAESCGVIFPEELDWCIEDCVGDTLPDDTLQACVVCLSGVSCETYDSCATSCTPAYYDLDVSGSGFSSWEGADVYVTIVDTLTDYAIEESGTWITNGAFAMEWTEFLEENRPIDLFFYVDVDADGSCNGNAVDFAWMESVPAVQADVTHVATPGVTTSDQACVPFNWWTPFALFVEGSGFSAYDGMEVVVSLLETYDGDTYASDWWSTTVAGGAFEVVFDWSLYSDATYEVAWFVDTDANLKCDVTDAAGTFAIPAPVLDDVHVQLSPGSSGAGSCGAFPAHGYSLEVNGSGFGADEGDQVFLLLFDGDGNLVDWGGDLPVANGAFQATFVTGLGAGEDYELLLWVDSDGDWACASPPDGAFRYQVPATNGHRTLSVAAGDPRDPSVCGPMNE